MILDPVRGRVVDIIAKDNHPVVLTADGLELSADLVVVAGEPIMIQYDRRWMDSVFDSGGTGLARDYSRFRSQYPYPKRSVRSVGPIRPGEPTGDNLGFSARQGCVQSPKRQKWRF